jgi:phospholipid/cholesterol/gamma-HCH transport system substrate-binding protein
MENKSHAFAAGLFALCLGLAVVLALYWLGGKREITHRYVVVTSQNVNGLNAQAQVKYRGIRVGKVDDIRIDPENQQNILITIQVREDVPLTDDTVAKMAYQGITGMAHILLEELDPRPSPPMLPNDEDPPRIVMMPSLMEELSEAGSGMLGQSKEFIGRANTLLNDENRRNFEKTLVNLAAASGAMKPALDNLNGTLTQVRKVLDDESVAQVKKAAGEVAPLLAETRALVSQMKSATDRIDLAIGDASGDGVAALMPRLNEMVSDVSASSRQLNRVLRVLEDSPQSLVFGAPPVLPGPGEPGFAVNGAK